MQRQQKASMLGYHAWLIANRCWTMPPELELNENEKTTGKKRKRKRVTRRDVEEMLRKLVHWIGRSWQACGSQEFDGDFRHVPEQGVTGEVHRFVLVSSLFGIAGVCRLDERIHMIGNEIIGKVVNGIFQLHGKLGLLGRGDSFRVVLERLSGLLIIHHVFLAAVTRMIGFKVAFDFACLGRCRLRLSTAQRGALAVSGCLMTG